MTCLASNSLRLKNLIYWKNFYYIDNYNYSYLIYNDFNFIFFLESFFTLKISQKFHINNFFFSIGIFFSYMKITKIYNHIILLLFFNKVGRVELSDLRETTFNYHFHESKFKWKIKKLYLRLHLLKLFFFKNLFKKKNHFNKKNWKRRRLMKFKFNFINKGVSLGKFKKHYKIMFFKADLKELIDKKIYLKKKYHFYKKRRGYFKKRKFKMKNFFLNFKKPSSIKLGCENFILKKKLNIKNENQLNFKNKFDLNFNEKKIIFRKWININRARLKSFEFFMNAIFKYIPFFSFLKSFFIYLYTKYFWKLNKPFLNVYFIIRKKHDITANLFMYMVLGKSNRYYKLPKILQIFNLLCDTYIKLNSIRGYKIICMGRFTRKDRAAYRWYHFLAPHNTKYQSINFCWRNIILRYSTCIIKIWICK